MTISATRSNSNYCPNDLVDQEINHEQIPGNWRRETANYDGLVSFVSQGSNNYSRSAKHVRETFKNYFNSEVGSVTWQQEIITRTLNPFDEDY